MAHAMTPQDTDGLKHTLDDVISVSADGKLRTTSLVVAERFGRDHDKVLRAIENLECSQGFRLANFGESSYANKQGRKMPMVTMTRDGFTFLAMGFTGSAAAEWKERFIDAFNAMETTLLQRSTFAIPPDLVEQQRRTDRALELLAATQVSHHSELVSILEKHDGRLDSLESMVNEIAKRRPFGAPSMRQWNGVVAVRYGGNCPCCQSKKIVDQFGRPIAGSYEADHWFSPGKNKVSDGWPVCRDCNHGVLEQDRLSRAPAFQQFHRLRKEMYPVTNLECKQLNILFEDSSERF